MKQYQSDGEFSKTKIYRRKGKDYHKKLKAQADGKDDHPLAQPYKRDNKGNLRNSIVVDGLGSDDD